MKTVYDHIVIGAGALGSAAAYRLAKAGHTDVLVLEQYELGHTHGASEDHSRIIRHAYHSTVYTALTPAAYAAWDEVEEETGLQLVFRVGGLDLAVTGTPGERELDAYEASLAPLAGTSVTWERLDAAQVGSRWPQWRIGDDVVGLFQPDGGILDVRRATAAHIALARARGVEFAAGTTVLGLSSTDTGVTVATSRGGFSAGSVVLCAASWTPTLLAGLGVDWPITLSQEQVSYFATPNLRDFAPHRFPMWIWHGEPFFYGFPVYGEVAVKAARDLSGHFVTQETRTEVPDPAQTELVAAFLRDHLPGAVGPELVSKTCVYDLPPDREFVLDHVPGHPRIVTAIGAGHAAKFASLLGQILAALATTGTTSHPIEAFRADRPALTDPAFVPSYRLAAAAP
ncbi:N-methyl-L-tryptophan oxidase [Jiangella aurantiaca]|uniref:N-methyl-L-tryptophan oxidase n=1 Tax=Jiangella aurantiaca TaxID=2530373 RepID=A0A4R5AEW5_9ACTN|nr:N-methyl-L-tryptophan oxidase [Jiangella aurantiaca]TDD69880.1 N-methyl-L-tryptophan oxidase [Jiangella aurantiaca]